MFVIGSFAIRRGFGCMGDRTLLKNSRFSDCVRCYHDVSHLLAMTRLSLSYAFSSLPRLLPRVTSALSLSKAIGTVVM